MKINKIISIFLVIFICLAFNVNAAENLSLKAKSAVLMDSSTGQILFEQNPNEKLPPASVTKIMTMLLIMEALESGGITLNDMVSTSEFAASMGGSQVFLSPGEQMSVHNMLKAIAVASGNDACVAMAEHIYGSEQAFVNAMNEKAKSLGMQNTNFLNSNGLDTENHYTTALDIAIMSRELLKHPKILEYTSIWMDTLRDGKFGLANTNKLVRFYKGANGLKTGSTSNALFCVSATAQRDNLQLISVVMGSPTSKDRFADASALLDYGFANYAMTKGVLANEFVADVEVKKGVVKTVRGITEKDFSFLISKGKKGNIEKKVEIINNVTAPIIKGQKLGELKFFMSGQEIGKVNIVANEAVLKYNFMSVFTKLLKSWINS